MIGKEYKRHKDNVIDLFNGYRKRRGDINDGVDIKFLEKQVQSLKDGKFTLAVAGEVKAGKSTFINALLGSEILPSDVLQSTNAIIEIFKNDTSFLRVKFADGHIDELYDDPETPDIDEADERLREISEIHDKYREIPTSLIDGYIIENEEKLVVNDEFIKILEQQSGEKLFEKRDIIEKYIYGRSKDKIPIEIEFGYPLKWDFDELRIVDSPGVNAIGGVQDISFRFFEKANAILFIHPIKPIESESFKKFVNSVISNRSKDTLFLILTHAGLYSNDEVERLHSEAKRLYKNVIPEERILVVDSLLKLIHNDLERGVSVKDIRKDEKKRKILSSYREQAEDENRELIDVVLEASRFEKMLSVIDEFSMKAPNLQLQEILEQIKKGYEEQEKQYADKIDLLENKKRNPQEFEEEINRINEALEQYKLLMKKTKEDLQVNYSGRHSLWQKDIEYLKAKFPELITGSDSIESARKNLVDGLNAVEEKVNEFSKELTQKLSDTLEKIGKDFANKHQITVPKVDLKALEEKAKKNSYTEEDRYETYYERHWYTLWLVKHKHKRKVGTRKVFDNEKFLGEYKTRCNEEFYKIINELPNKSKEVLNCYLKNFSEEMNSVINERQKALKKEKDKQQSNEQIIEEINKLQIKKNVIQPEKQRCIEVLEDLI